MTLRRAVLVAGTALLVAATVLVFIGFDRTSHSASDTLRPFLLTMVPVWAIAIVAARLLLTRRP
jgi:hypothetical protein